MNASFATRCVWNLSDAKEAAEECIAW